ncbi:MAG: branched-chain amino acid transporter permease [Hyphomicrobiales bacterium]|nr:branched-chain amino acid transporter permease [Hyphomicrobiales bacterium]
MSRIAAVLALLAMATIPLVAGEFYINLATQILIAAVFALSLNLLVGYGGLTSLGHASFLGFSAYACAWFSTRMGLGPTASVPIAILATTLMAAFFGLIALRATGLGFLMITLALSQVLWGLAYRWVGVTNGDNGMSGITRPEPFGISLASAGNYFWFTLVVSTIAFAMMTMFVSSAFGSSLQGTRDQPLRMAALGHNVWLVRWLTFVYAGFWAGVAGILYIYYHKYIHPTSLSISSSAEGLLSVIAGGAGTLSGPIAGAALLVLLKNYASAYVERWNMLLGFIFVLIVLVIPEGIVPGTRRLLGRLRRGDK